MAVRLVALAGLVAVATACSHSQTRSGVVTGALPLCYGPSPSINLAPTATIKVYRGGQLVSTTTFPASSEHRSYTLTLPAGEYELRMPDRNYLLKVQVKPASKTQSDWPQPQCL
jgi:hypothetical protein